MATGADREHVHKHNVLFDVGLLFVLGVKYVQRPNPAEEIFLDVV